MTTNLVVYESVGHKARAVARVFLGECATDAPRRLADFLRSKKLDVVQFAWNFQLDDGTVDIRDEYPRPGETLRQLVTEYVIEWVNAEELIRKALEGGEV